MLRKKTHVITACGLFMALSTGVASALAGGSYNFSVIAKTGNGLNDIVGGSLNNAGTIIFDGLDENDASQIYDVDGLLLDAGHSSTLSEDDDIYFVRHVPVGELLRPAVFQYVSVASDELIPASLSRVTVSQLSATSGGDLAFWAFSCCSPAETCVLSRDAVGTLDDLRCAGLGHGCSVVASPVMNDAGHVAYLQQCAGEANGDTMILLDLGGSEVGVENPETGWILGSPTINNASDIAFVVHEPEVDGDAKIYVRTNGDGQVTERLSFNSLNLLPSAHTNAFINDNGDIAFAARLVVVAASGARGAPDPIEAILVLKAGETDPEFVVAEGEMVEDMVLQDTFQLLGFNASGEVLFKANGTEITNLRGGAGSATVLVASEPLLGSCPGDLDANGTVNVADLLLQLSDFGSCPGCDADLNGDDNVDVQDLLMLLSFFGPCPAPQ